MAGLAGLASCGGGDGQAAEPSTTTTEPPDPPDVEFRVALVGDSVMENMVPAIETALATDPRVATDFTIQATLSLEQAVDLQWYRIRQEFDPDVVVMLVGYWELTSPAFAAADHREEYVDQVLNRVANDATEDGADLLWIGMPAVRSPEQTSLFDQLNALYEFQAQGRFDVDYLDAGDYLNGPDDEFEEFLPDATGAMERTRRLEQGNMHFCPAGVVRVVGPILQWLAAKYPITVTPGWETADWRLPENLVRPEECPLVG